ncbi:methyltransferase domain-containing protein [Ramlibacter albus]|uniref:Methyltransferase domain-containing protein n=1 Tax=Ramlibacter albus TaxID=2079448 RepID=A0A923S1X2_9BURK|nr:methyltransferase domain-containing protein [Ramlibacter albus]MBC5764750.1 methyltransferase domain-containing protein [Ramlibacter albus]
MPVRDVLKQWAWAAARRAHHLDFAYLLPAIAKLPIPLGHRLAALRGELNARLGRDWRSMALGFRHIRSHCIGAYRELQPSASQDQLAAWTRGRFVAEARDEYESRLTMAGRVEELECEIVAPFDLKQQLSNRERGLVLLTPHYQSFFLGIAFLARASGALVNSMSSSVTHDPRVDPAVQRHFDAKYRALERYIGGKVPDHETGSRQFYRMLQRKEVLVILGDAPVLPDGAAMAVDFLGAKRELAGGALRMARATGSDVGAFVCRHLGGKRYRIEMSEIGSANDESAIAKAYRFLGTAIEADPGGWWASDLITAMPRVASSAGDIEALVITDSLLSGSGELAQGLPQLRRSVGLSQWHERHAADATPLGFLAECTASRVLVLLEPSLLATSSLAPELARCMDEAQAACVTATDPRDASGEWGISYTTLGDFETYVARRTALPVSAPVPAHPPVAMLLDVARTRDLLRERPQLSWADLPSAFGAAAVQAPRAFVHSYAAYQQGNRMEMLELLPEGVKTLLDIGGGEGGFARAFAVTRGGEAWLVEPSEAATRAAPHDRVHVVRGKLQELDASLHGRFDAVSFLDVLEHVTDPGELLRAARPFLREGGHVLVSVPNVGHWSVVRDLAQGRFDYLPVGILCATHIRFFTERSVRELLEAAGFEPMRWRRAGPSLPPEFEQFAAAARQAGIAIDRDSLATESLHVLARLG